MDHKEAVAKFEKLKEVCLEYRQGDYSEAHRDVLARLYGELEPII